MCAAHFIKNNRGTDANLFLFFLYSAAFYKVLVKKTTRAKFARVALFL